jgi:hypothetical protein
MSNILDKRSEQTSSTCWSWFVVRRHYGEEMTFKVVLIGGTKQNMEEV